MNQEKCYCCSPKKFQDCCEPYINQIQKVLTAEALMRSRYSAYVIHAVDYLMVTTHIKERKYHSKTEILNWAKANQWQRLEVIYATKNTVEFKAYYIDAQLQQQIHHEYSNFIFEEDNWFYVDGKFY
jgi:SEC-C motif domain protein